MKTAKLGTVSHGTLRTQDLIEAFSDTLRALSETDENDALLNDASAWLTDASGDEYNADTGGEILEELQGALMDAAPPYAYFGTLEGDGSDFGFWLPDFAEIKQQVLDDGGLVVADTSEIPGGFAGEALHVNDHGNATLYVCASDGTRREMWSVV